MQACNLFISVPFAARSDNEPFGDPVRRSASPALKRAYVEAVVREMEGFSEDAEELAIESVTLGTGTTNSLPVADLHLVLSSAKRLFSIAPETPVYAAFDPGLLSAASLDELRSLGDPRPDFRYLTSDPRESEALGRPDAETEMRESDALLKRVGVRAIGMQVAVGIAGQTKDSLTRTLCDMRRPCVERIELVPLRPESPLALPDDDAAALLRHASEWLSEHGFAPSGPLRFVRGEDNPLFRRPVRARSHLGRPGDALARPGNRLVRRRPRLVEHRRFRPVPKAKRRRGGHHRTRLSHRRGSPRPARPPRRPASRRADRLRSRRARFAHRRRTVAPRRLGRTGGRRALRQGTASLSRGVQAAGRGFALNRSRNIERQRTERQRTAKNPSPR